MTDQGHPLADPAAERAVLGALILSPAMADEVSDRLGAGDFYDGRHAMVYAAITGLLAQALPVDAVALAHALAASGDLGRIGGGNYLHDLVVSVPTAANAGYYADIVANFATRRRLRETAIRLDRAGTDLGREIADVIDEAQRAVHEATLPRSQMVTPTFGDLVDATLAEILGDSPRRGLSTGLGVLDDELGGLKGGQLIIVAARPGIGKSMFVTHLARRTSIRDGVPSLTASLEMSEGEVMCRILSAETGIDLTRILHGRLLPRERELLRAKADAIRHAPLRIDAGRQGDLAIVRAVARRTQQRHGLGLLIIDYLQLMTSGRSDNRAVEVGEISRGLKLLGGQLDIPVVACAQLNRNPEQRADKRPQLSDLRESGSIEADADVVILLHRPGVQGDHGITHDRAGEIDLIIAKNRNGPAATVTAAVELSTARFSDPRMGDR